ncbi:hypothetical protein TCAL_07111 [Tigriopus californicus]|uniref:Methylated-DNA--protein-cysteine methyltransferase n=2 Tax=Tigriopus californicus TaxID=6832 RepID=A0A553PAV3_TIGCA|nr:hypothetical protein TCAL_07111 [Tigriopus californicus]
MLHMSSISNVACAEDNTGMMSPPQDSNPKLPHGYCDLNLPYEPVSTIQARVIRAVALGYQTLAISVSVHQDELTYKNRKHKAAKKAKLDPDESEQMTDFPEPPRIIVKPEDHAGYPAPVILTRLNLTVNDNNFQPIWNSSETGKKYDLVAICPTSAPTLTNILKSAFRADIVAFDPENVRDVRWSRKLYNECVSQLMFFEINYAPCIRDTSTRRTTISQSHNYHLYGKSKAIFMSSGATNVLEMRGPHDVANLGFLFGLNEHQGKLAVKGIGHQVVKTALGRKMGPFRALIQKVDQLPEEEQWKVPEDAQDESEEEEGIRMKVTNLECDLSEVIISSPIGNYKILACPQGLHQVGQTDDVDNNNFLALGQAIVQFVEGSKTDNPHLLTAFAWMTEYFSNNRDISDKVQVCPQVIGESEESRSFRQKVWMSLKLKVGLGETVSYAQLAALAGSAGASRAVGSAMANNPIGLIIPCHRVVKSDGSYGNYAKSTKNDVKTWLLTHEQSHADKL